MGTKTPLQIEIEKTKSKVDLVHRAYNLFFQGVEKKPPHAQLSELEKKMGSLKADMSRQSNQTCKQLYAALDIHFQSHKRRWQKKLMEIESGVYTIPAKRK